MPRINHPHFEPSAKRAIWIGGPAAGVVVGALALLAAFLASGDAHAQPGPVQAAPAQSGPAQSDAAELSLGDAGPESSISIVAQVTLVWQADGRIVTSNTNFTDGRSGAEASSDHVVAILQQAAVSALGQAAMSGARTGHVDVVATVYQFAGGAASLSAWAPLGIFINTTDMAVESAGGQAAFHTRVQFIPDASRQPQPEGGAGSGAR